LAKGTKSTEPNFSGEANLEMDVKVSKFWNQTYFIISSLTRYVRPHKRSNLVMHSFCLEIIKIWKKLDLALFDKKTKKLNSERVHENLNFTCYFAYEICKT
jgi:hypothetical protein